MHYLTFVVVDSIQSAYSEVREKLESYKEIQKGDCPFDWYQIGGRWQGHFDKSYKAEDDPRNYKTCDHCKYSFIKPCGQCKGTGRFLAWSTDWADHAAGNIKKIECPDDFDEPGAILTHDFFLTSYLFREGEWEGIVKGFLKSNIRRYVVIVDCHC